MRMLQLPLIGVFLILVAAPCLEAQNATSTATLCEGGCVLPPPGLIGWWAGDGDARDIQLGSGGELVNGVTFAQGLVDQAFALDGIDDVVDVPDTPALHAVSTGFTVGVWINPQDQLVAEGFVFARRDPMVSESVSVSVSWEGFLRVFLQADEGSLVTSTVPVVKRDGNWQYIAVSADTASGEIHLYYDGSIVPHQFEDGSVSISGRFADVEHLFFGHRQDADTSEGEDGTMHYRGLIDEIQFYNRALSPQEIQAIFFAGRRGTCKPKSH